VKERFSGRPALATGIYTTGIQIGAVGLGAGRRALAAAGSWRLALAVLGAAAALVTAAWLALDRGRTAEPPRAPALAELRAVARAPVVWRLIGAFALMTVVYYGLISWLSEAYVEKGWDEGPAAGLVAVVSFAQIPGSLLVAWLGGGRRRRADRRPLLRARRGRRRGGGGARRRPGRRVAVGRPGGPRDRDALRGPAHPPLDLSSHATEAGAIAAVMLTGGYTSAALTPWSSARCATPRDRSRRRSTRWRALRRSCSPPPSCFPAGGPPPLSILPPRRRCPGRVAPVAAAQRGGKRHGQTDHAVHRQWADLKLEDVAARCASWGYDGLELACWGDHFEVDRALAEPDYVRNQRALLERHGLGVWAIGNHLVGQAVCDPSTRATRASCRPRCGATATPRACAPAPPSG
jgi:hypothetical protein